MCNHFTKMDIALKMTSGFLVACGTIAGAISLNPIVLGIVSGSGMPAGIYAESKNYKKKIEMTRFTHSTYESILAD